MNSVSAPTPAAQRLNLEYTSVDNEYYRITFDHVHQLAIVGAKASASYEWILEDRGKIVAHSNDGYGQFSMALRDGLIAYHGLGNVLGQVDFYAICTSKESSQPE